MSASDHGRRVLRALAATASVAVIALACLPAEEWERPSLTTQLVAAVYGFFAFMLSVTALIHLGEIREWHRDRVLVRGCRHAWTIVEGRWLRR